MNLPKNENPSDTENYIKQLQEERDSYWAALASISLFLGVGMGDEKTTAQQYVQRIQEGIIQMVQDFSQLSNPSKKVIL